jgi:voltage-gated potassium channel
MSFRQKIYNLIKDDKSKSKAGLVCDWLIISFILISVIQITINTFPMDDNWAPVSNIIEYITIGVFTIEYILRLWTAPIIYPQKTPLKARLRYLVTPLAIIDLLAILPFYIPFVIPMDLRALRAIRIIRLLRLLKLSRYTDAMSILGKVIRQKSSQLLSAVFVVGLLLFVASLLMFTIENKAQPETFSNLFDAFWWAVATLTTVGYGDIYPITAFGKVLSGIIAVLGIGMVAIPTGIISAGFIGELDKEKKSKEKEFLYCPYCGEKLDKD